MQPSRASGLRRTPQKRNRRPMISQGTPGAAKLTIILLGSISSSPKLYPNQSRTRVARPMVSQGTQSRASMGNSQTVLAFHCIARLFFRDLFPDPRRTNHDPGCATFPGAGETLPRPCSQSARSLRGLTYLCFTERCICDALSFASEVCRVIGQNTVSTRLRSSEYLGSSSLGSRLWPVTSPP